jgi:hypothetical protein
VEYTLTEIARELHESPRNAEGVGAAPPDHGRRRREAYDREHLHLAAQ